MKKVLLLSYFDKPAEGHALSRYKSICEKGYEAFFLSLLSEFSDDTPAYFINAHKKNYPWNLIFWYKCIRKIHQLRCGKRKIDEHCFYNISYFYSTTAKQILKKTCPNPDVIILGWFDYFISPKTIYDLYKITKAKIVIPMVDAHILGGGCHYPCECEQYMNGCKACPALTSSKPAINLYRDKVKYLTDIPFTLVGTLYDLQRAQKVSFLRNKTMIQTIGTPKIPFVKSSEAARADFGIAKDDYVIMCGAALLSDKRKGFGYLVEAINKFCAKIENRKVTLLLLGEGELNVNFPKEINVVSPGFLELNRLFTAFYASDIFVSPSVDDSGPYMVNYSIACGTPVISFPIGIALNLVIHKQTGYIADFLDSNDLARGVEMFYYMDKNTYNACSINCIKLMEELRKNNNPWYFEVLK